MSLVIKKPFSIPVRVYFEDTDAGGIVFYINYLKFMERARTELLRTVHFESGEMINRHLIFVVADAQVKYHQPARLDDVLEVTAELESVGRSRLIFTQQVTLQKNNARLCSGRIVVACVNTESMKPVAIPAEIAEGIHRLVDSPV